jgi:hypothetical protein
VNSRSAKAIRSDHATGTEATNRGHGVRPGLQEKAIDRTPQWSNLIGKMSSVFGDDKSRLEPCEYSGQSSIEEWRVLMGVNQINVFLPESLRKPIRTPPVQPRPTMENFSGGTATLKFFAKAAELVQTNKNEAEFMS